MTNLLVPGKMPSRQANDLVCPSGMSALFSRTDVHRDLAKGLKSGVVPRPRFRDLSHTAASLVLNHGRAALVVSKVLGHAKSSMTLTVCAHSALDVQTQATSVVDGIVTPTPVSITRAERVLAK